MKLKGKIFRKYVVFARLIFPGYTYLEELRTFFKKLFCFNEKMRLVGFLRFSFVLRTGEYLQTFEQRCSCPGAIYAGVCNEINWKN